MKKIAGLFLVLIFALFTVACDRQKNESKVINIKLAVLPVLDALPLFVALEEGYFKELGLEVEVLPVASPVERDQLMQTNSAQAMINELSSVMLFNQEAIGVQAVLVARKASSTAPVFQILSAPGASFTSASDLAGIPVAVSEKTVIEYISTRILEKAGLLEKQIRFENVPVIAERFGLLMAGKIQAATLPDPLSQAALLSGARLVTDDRVVPELSFSIVSFQKGFIDQQADAVGAFVSAWNKAARQLNHNKADYWPLVLKHIPVPEVLQTHYQLPDFPVNQLPDKAQWEDTARWMKGRSLISQAPSFEESVNSSFLE